MPGRIRRLARDLLAETPGGLETALILRDAILPLHPSFRPGRAFKGWLRELDNGRTESSLEPRRVLFFACGPHWLNVSLAAALVLVSRRCRVDFAFLPYSRIDRQESPAELKAFEVNYGRFLRNARRPGLRFIDLMRCEPARASEAIVEEARRQSAFDAQYALKREEIDPAANLEHRRVREFCFRRNLDCMLRLASLLEHDAYDVMVVPNGNSCQFGGAFRLARLADRRVVCFEFGECLETILISSDAPSTDMDTSQAWSADVPHVLSPEVSSRVRELIRTREGTDWKGFLYTCQKSVSEADHEKVLARLGIRRDGRRIALMCPNVAWDSALLGRDAAFPSLVEWMRQSVAFFAARKDAWLVVRIHPAETMIGTDQPVADVIREACPDLPDHVRVVHPDDPVNTYDLMDVCDFGLVYNSTAGLEMALRGLPVVVAARPHYAGKGFTTDVETEDEYFRGIDEMLARPEEHRLSARRKELAWCYADVYFFRWPKPFPWSLGAFWEDMQRWPMARVLSEDGQARFGKSFDLLVNRLPE